MQSPPPPRRGRVVLATPEGAALGTLPELPLATPWWPDVGPLVAAVRDAYRLEIVVLRMLDSERPHPPGGLVTYLAEVAGAVPPGVRDDLLPYDVALDEQPLRRPYARPGGPGADVAWAESVLRDRRIERGGAPVQVKTWNLSSIWRLPLGDGTNAWLKVVPPFFAHEGDVLRRLQDRAVPRLLGHDGARILLADIEGEDQYDAELPVLLRMVSTLVELQADWMGREDELLAIGLPDWRAPALTAGLRELVDRRCRELDPRDADTLTAFADDLPARFATVARCGIADTLVHGDFHPGNVRGTRFRLTLLDWGDTGVGHPLLDLPAFVSRIPGDAVPAVRERWLGAWRALLPDSDPGTAARLLEPVAAARQALIYQGFVDRIEPVERRYHEVDVTDWLAECARVLRAAADEPPVSAGC